MIKLDSKILASFLIAVILISSLYTSIPNFYQQSYNTDILQLNTIPLAYADDEDDDKDDNSNGRHDDDDEEEDDVDDAEDLVEEYEEIIEELGKISSISDEAVVTDYLTDAITDLKDDTKNLVSDKHARKDLIKILDHALKRAEKSAKNVLKLKEDGANKEIDKVRSFIQDYIDEVEELRDEGEISSETADNLIGKANQILTNSLKRSTGADDLIAGNQLIITSQIINQAKLDVISLREIVTELRSLGFATNITIVRNSPAEVHITFSNSSTSQVFEVIPSNDTLAALMTVGIEEEAPSKGIILNQENVAALSLAAPAIVNQTVISEDLVEAGLFLIAITCVGDDIQKCIAVSGTFLTVLAVIILNMPIQQIIRQQLQRGASDALALLFFKILPPKLIVNKNVINNDGGILSSSDFTIQVSGASADPSEFSGVSEEDGGKEVKFTTTGSYSVDEVPVDGYDSSKMGDCSGNIDRDDFGLTKTCTITNDDVFVGPPPPLFSENFDEPLTGYTGGGQIGQTTSGPNGEPPSSPPNWGFVGVPIVNANPCLRNIEVIQSKDFSVPTEGNYKVSALVGGGLCDICVMSGRVFVDNLLFLVGEGSTLGPPAVRLPQFRENTVPLAAGPHTLGLGMHSTIACNGFFTGFFDDVKVEGPTSTLAASSSGSMTGGLYFSVDLDQTTVNAARGSTITIPVQVNWQDGYPAKEVSIDVIGVNATGISHSVTSTSQSTSYQLFDIVFDIPADMQTGEHLFLISVKEMESDDTVGVGVALNVQ